MAGGVNLYAYAGGNPIAYTDPFGLCPPDDTNVATCGNSNIDNAWRALDRSAAGQAVIASYVGLAQEGWKINVSQDRYCQTADNCTNRDERVVTVENRAGGAMAMGLAHEVVHAKGSAPANTLAGGLEERQAWTTALGVYRRFNAKESREAQLHYKSDFTLLNSVREGRFLRKKECDGRGVQFTCDW